jgi:hypothetical protein
MRTRMPEAGLDRRSLLRLSRVRSNLGRARLAFSGMIPGRNSFQTAGPTETRAGYVSSFVLSEMMRSAETK